MKIKEMIDQNDAIKPGDVLMIETDTSALVGTVLGVKDGAVLVEGSVYPMYEQDDNVIRSLPRRQAEKNRTPYRYNADIAEQIPRYDSVKRRNIPAGFEMDNPNAVPYDRFEAVPVNDRIANIVGIAPDGGKVKVSTTTVQAAIALADAYNRGGFTDQDIQRVRFDEVKQRLDPKCWKGYRKQGTKIKDGVRVNNCVKVSEDNDRHAALRAESDRIYLDALNQLITTIKSLQAGNFENFASAFEDFILLYSDEDIEIDILIEMAEEKYKALIEQIPELFNANKNTVIKGMLYNFKNTELGEYLFPEYVRLLKYFKINWPELKQISTLIKKSEMLDQKNQKSIQENNDMDEEEEELYYDAINHMGNLYHALTDGKFTQAAGYLSELGMLYQEAGVYLPDAIDMITDRRTKMHIERIYSLLDDNKDDVIRGILTMIKTGNESATSVTNLISVLDEFGAEWPELDTLEAAVIKALPDRIDEAEYRGRKVQLGKPMRGDVRKYKVFVKDPKTGNIKKVNFGDPNMEIRRDDPKRRASFRARHGCGTPRASDRTKAAYWSCRMWSKKPVSKILKGK